MPPYYQTAHAALYHGDCLAVLPDLAAASVDLVLADLPYGTTACAWDGPISLPDLWREYKRVLKPRGAVVLTASQPFTSVLVTSNLAWFRCAWVWDKVNLFTNQMNAKTHPMRQHEDVLVFSEQPSIYNPQMRRSAPYKTRRRAQIQVYAITPRDGVNDTGLMYPGTVLTLPARNITEQGLHPTQKPVALGRYFVRTYSNPGDLVLDNTMGVGSFGVAAIEEGRRFIGIERAPDPTTPDDYCGIARDRILAAEAARGGAVPMEHARMPLQLGMALDFAS